LLPCSLSSLKSQFISLIFIIHLLSSFSIINNLLHHAPQVASPSSQALVLSTPAPGSISEPCKTSRAVQSRRWCVTINDPEGLGNVSQQEVEGEYWEPPSLIPTDGGHFSYLVWQLERAPTTGKVHLQGYFELKKKARLTQLKDIPGLSKGHFERAKGTADQNTQYCTKLASRILLSPYIFGQPVANGVSTPYQEFCLALSRGEDVSIPSGQHFNTYVRHWRAADVILQRLREKHPADLVLPDIQLHLWQLDIIQHCTHPSGPHPRRIYWFYDRIGGAGKSTFAAFLVKHHNSVLIDSTVAHRALMAFSRSSYTTVIFDITRQDGFQDKVNYSTLETFKNQVGFIAMYDPRMVILPPVHVIVFSNFPPRSGDGGLSADRVITRDICSHFKSISDPSPELHNIFINTPSPVWTCPLCYCTILDCFC